MRFNETLTTLVWKLYCKNYNNNMLLSLISVQASQGNSCYTCCTLKMLGLYLYTLIKGHKYCNMLSILNELTLVKKLQNFVTMFFWTKS